MRIQLWRLEWGFWMYFQDLSVSHVSVPFRIIYVIYIFIYLSPSRTRRGVRK